MAKNQKGLEQFSNKTSFSRHPICICYLIFLVIFLITGCGPVLTPSVEPDLTPGPDEPCCGDYRDYFFPLDLPTSNDLFLLDTCESLAQRGNPEDYNFMPVMIQGIYLPGGDTPVHFPNILVAVENEYGSVLIEDIETNYYRNGEWDSLIFVPKDEPVRIFAIASDEYLSGEYDEDELRTIAPDLVVSSELVCLLSDLTEARMDDYDLDTTEIPDARAITEDNPIGETIVTYPQYMSPGSTGLVVLSIYVPIPPELFDVFSAEADPVDVTRVEVIAEPQDDVPVGKSITYQGTIRVGETMIAKLESHNFNGIARQIPEQQLFLDGSRIMTTWLWDIEAPSILGKQNFTILVWRDNYESNPIWRGDFEIEIIGLTPVPSKTSFKTATAKPSSTPKPSNTPEPTQTMTLTPTKSISEKISEGLINEIPQVILWFLGILLLILIVIVLLYTSKKSAIQGLVSQLEESNDELEKIKIQEQIDILQQQSLWKQFLEWARKRVMGGDN